MDLNKKLIQYDFEFNNKNLKMVGRSSVQSDHDIIALTFLKKMFHTEHMSQNQNLICYYNYLIAGNYRPVLIDAGANIGAASLYFNQIYPLLKTISIEPDIENAQLLQRNLSEFDVEIIQGALGCKDEIMFLDTKNFGPIAYRVSEEGNIEVMTYSIPSIIKKLMPSEKPFILKIDIEGGEDSLFSSNFSWINEFPLIIIELHDWMLPFKNISKNFYKAISSYDFDLIQYGENTFCFNSTILKKTN
jgi:FkbM family methyltransferase